MTKDSFLAALDDEIARIVFLAEKVTPADFDFRLSESARSTIELLRYLATAGIVPAKAMINGNYDHYAGYKEKSDGVTLDGFAEAMAEQREEIGALVRSLTDEEWANGDSKLPWGTPRATCDAMVESTLAFLVAYRMQLYLHLKANGHDDYSTYECWAALDNPKRVSAGA